MAKLSLPSAVSGYNLGVINDNFDSIEAELQDKVLYRDNPTGEPNQMENNLDMNSNRILNLSAPSNVNEAARLQDVINGISGATQANLITIDPLTGQSSTTVQEALEDINDDVIAHVAATAAAFANLPINIKNITKYGCVGDGVTVNTAALQAVLDLGGDILVPNGTFVSGTLTASVAGTRLIMAKGAILNFPTLGANTKGITVTAGNFTVEGGAIQGPGTAPVDVSNEAGIWMKGASSASRLSGLTLRGVEMSGFGQYAIYGQFVNKICIEDCNVHDTRMHAICWLSCSDIREVGNWIHDIPLGDNLNAYGMIHSHDATSYNLDPSASSNGRLAANPFCIGVYIADNVVENISWEGIDCHGAYDTSIVNNRVYNTKLGISAPSSSNDGAAYAGEQNFVTGNLVTGYKRDGTDGGHRNLGYGINLNGGSIVNNRRIVCTGNTLIAKGEISVDGGGAIRAIYCMHVVIADNNIHDWGGQCIYTVDTVGIISGNNFGGMTSSGDTAGQLIRAGGNADRLTITNNRHWYADKSRAQEGLRVLNTNTNRQMLSGNDFSEATTPWIVTPYQVVGTDISPALDVPGSSTSVDVSSLLGWNGVVELSGGSSHDVEDVVNISQNQELVFVKTGAGTVTFKRSGTPGLYLDGGANKTITGNNNITLRKLGTKVTQTAYSASS